MALNKNKVGLIGASVVALGALAAFITDYTSEAEAKPEFVGNENCGQTNLKRIDVYTTGGATATYDTIHCEVDQFGKVIVTEGTFTVDRNNVSDTFVVAALGQTQAQDIKNLLNGLVRHSQEFTPTDYRVVEGMSCEPSVEFKGIEDMGGIKMAVVETRKNFVNPMANLSGCEINTRHIFGDLSTLEQEFGSEAGKQIRQIMELASTPMVYEPTYP